MSVAAINPVRYLRFAHTTLSKTDFFHRHKTSQEDLRGLLTELVHQELSGRQNAAATEHRELAADDFDHSTYTLDNAHDEIHAVSVSADT